MNRKIVRDLLKNRWPMKNGRLQPMSISSETDFWGGLKKCSLLQAVNQAMVLDTPNPDELAELGMSAELWSAEEILKSI